MLSFLSSSDCEEDDTARSEMLAEASMLISNCNLEFDELIQSTWRTLMHSELTLTEQMEVSIVAKVSYCCRNLLFIKGGY